MFYNNESKKTDFADFYKQFSGFLKSAFVAVLEIKKASLQIDDLTDVFSIDRNMNIGQVMVQGKDERMKIHIKKYSILPSKKRFT